MISNFPRRAFLYAVGALWGLSWTEQLELSDSLRSGRDDETDDDKPEMLTCGDDLYWSYLDERRGHNGSISVAVDPENNQSPIVVEGYLDRSRFDVGFGPDEAVKLAEELMTAKEEIQA